MVVIKLPAPDCNTLAEHCKSKHCGFCLSNFGSSQVKQPRLKKKTKKKQKTVGMNYPTQSPQLGSKGSPFSGLQVQKHSIFLSMLV